MERFGIQSHIFLGDVGDKTNIEIYSRGHNKRMFTDYP